MKSHLPSKTPSNLGTQFEEIGKTFQGVPHIYLGKNGFSTINIPKPQNIPNLNTQNANLRGSTDKGYETYEKMREWGLWIIVLSVVGYAGFRIIKIILFGS